MSQRNSAELMEMVEDAYKTYPLEKVNWMLDNITKVNEQDHFR
jgi:hypothetical protein